MPLSGLDAFFLDGAAGRLFCLLHEPPAGVHRTGAVLYFHPFAEEMNRSRRMAALQAMALAEAGWSVLIMDAVGCGDSEGHFGAASWNAWVEDGSRGAAWLKLRTGFQPVLWGLRAGCLMAVAVASRMDTPCRFVFWHPVLSGKQHLQQFLRLKVAGAMLDENRATSGSTRQLREQLLVGQSIEVAGYVLAPDLALGLEAATLKPPAAAGQAVVFEVSSAAAEQGLSPALAQMVEAWRTAGWDMQARVVAGTGFWQTVEIEEVPALLVSTVKACERFAA